MSRAAVYAALRDDPVLTSDFNIGVWNIFGRNTIDVPPNRTDPFVVLQWSSREARPKHGRGPRILTIWIHIPKQASQDYADIDPILDRIVAIMAGLPGTKGSDEYTVNDVRYTGDSEDLLDIGYDTIVRNAAFEVLSSRLAI